MVHEVVIYQPKLENEHDSLSLNQTSLELSTHNNSWPTAIDVMQQRPVCRRLHIFYSVVLLRHELHHLSIHAGAVSWTASKETRGHEGFIFLAFLFQAPKCSFRAHLASAISSILKMTKSCLNSCWTSRELRIHVRHRQSMDSSPHCCFHLCSGDGTGSWSPRLGFLPPLPVRTVLGANEM